MRSDGACLLNCYYVTPNLFSQNYSQEMVKNVVIRIKMVHDLPELQEIEQVTMMITFFLPSQVRKYPFVNAIQQSRFWECLPL